ncbi:acyl carrier protein [Aliivibrio fischeri]|uniref:Acyl carrier protein n=1 Tax=Aliivibrio fischeri TaxID=668 RepID=A0A844P0N8_ALIFS|nr:acyl carrier protein [Aliivibrio fischeri]MUK49019.1 acyl carrier protein [Aliivibrio fischeri]
MDKNQFLEELTDILQLEDTLSLDVELVDLEEWDSMAFLGVISFFDMEFNKTVTQQELKSVKTAADLFVLSEKK